MAKKKEFTFIDLFAGIGGFHLACHNQGGECVFVSEWDEPARETYTANFKKIAPKIFDKKGNPTDLFVGDITKVDENDIPDFDLLCAGFPCQPFSQAGLKKGFEDTRGTLFFDIARIIKKKKPKAVFLENVRGLRNHDGGKTFEVICNTMEQVGYKFHTQIIKASDYGVPQNRPRLFMVGIRKDLKDTFSFPEPIELTKTMSDIFDGKKCNREIGFTLRVGGRGSNINDRRNWDSYLVDGEVVRIGPKEGKRLQGFPDSFEFPVCESQAMKQLGNSVAVPAVEATVREIKRVLKENKC